MNLKLGKKPAQHDPKDLKYALYSHQLDAINLVIPSHFGQGHAFEDWGMLGNDDYGDCVLAEAAHSTMLYTKIGAPATAHFDDHAVLSDYTTLTGFDPNDPSTDQGTDMHAAMNYRRHVGVIDKLGRRHRIAAYVALRPGDWNQLLQAVYVFGSVSMGFKFPESAMWQFNHGFTWDIAPPEDIQGGHDVAVVGSMAKNKRATCITWGQRQEFTRRFYETYCTTPQHRTLTSDLKWVQIGNLCVGDHLMTFEETAVSRGGRRFQDSVVTRVEHTKAEVLDVELSSGEVITVTPEHKWLITGTGYPSHWVSTDKLRTERLRTRFAQIHRGASENETARSVTRLSKILPVWETLQGYDDGWLAGFLDGEGSLCADRSKLAAGGYTRTRLTFGQNSGPVLDRALDHLGKLGMLGHVQVKPRVSRASINLSSTKTLTKEYGVTYVHVDVKGKKADRIRLLGSIRPRRLLDSFNPDHTGRMETYESVSVVDVRSVGKRDIVKVSTSSGTMFVDGYPMHNCDEAYVALSEEILKSDGKGLHGFDLATLRADLLAL